MNLSFPHIPEPRSNRAWIAVIVVQAILLALIVGLVAWSIGQQHQQDAIRASHNDGACAMRVLTGTLISRTEAALKRPSTRPQDKPGYRQAIAAYKALHDAQDTVPANADCARILKP